MFILLLGFLYPFLGATQTALLTIAIGLLIYFIRKAKKSHSYWKDKGINYVKPTFLLGNMKIFFRKKSFTEGIQDLYNHYPNERYHGVYQFLQPILILKDPQLIKQITIKEFDSFTDRRTFVDPESDPLFSKNLAASVGEKWKDLRSTLSPTFTSSKMKMMFHLMEECSEQFIEYFKKQKGDVLELEMRDTFTRYANDVIASTAFGLECNSLKDPKNDFYMMGKEATSFNTFSRAMRIFAYSVSPFLTRLLKVRIIPKYLTDYFSNIIKDTMNNREENNIIRPDVIHLLMEARKGRLKQEDEPNIDESFSTASHAPSLTKSNKKIEITFEDIVANAFIFFLAGFETTSTFLTFLFYELVANPDVQTRLRKEIRDVVKNGKVTYEVLLGMKYMDMVVSESLRKWSPAAFSDRTATKSFTIEPERPGEKALVLEKGSICWVPIFSIHRDPKFYPNPDKFDPERFNDENKQNIDPFTYMPFGSGPRNCIGSRFALLEGKLLIFHILNSFEIVPIKRTQIPIVLDKKEINLRPEGGIWVGFKKIN